MAEICFKVPWWKRDVMIDRIARLADENGLWMTITPGPLMKLRGEAPLVAEARFHLTDDLEKILVSCP